MCDRGTPWRERMACKCLPVTGLGGALVVGGIVVAAEAHLLLGIVIAMIGACAGVVAYTALQWRRIGIEGVWLVHRTHRWVEDPAPQLGQAPAEVPWYERARTGPSRGSGAMRGRTGGSRSAPIARSPRRTTPPGAPPPAGRLPELGSRR